MYVSTTITKIEIKLRQNLLKVSNNYVHFVGVCEVERGFIHHKVLEEDKCFVVVFLATKELKQLQRPILPPPFLNQQPT